MFLDMDFGIFDERMPCHVSSRCSERILAGSPSKDLLGIRVDRSKHHFDIVHCNRMAMDCKDLRVAEELLEVVLDCKL